MNDDAPWLNTTYDGFMTHEEMLEIAAQREADNIELRKTLEEMTRQERVDSAIQEIWYIVQGGQDGREYAESIYYLIKVLESLV